MFPFFIFLIVGFFIALLFLNIYFRVKVLKNYRVLVQNRVQFDKSHMMNLEKLEQEIIPRYPKFSKEIRGFVHNIRFSVKIAVVLVILITIVGTLLYYNQD